MPPRLLATMVTTTTYGTWLPGDLRGYVDHGIILPGDPARLAQAAARMAGDPVLLTPDQQSRAFAALRDAAAEFGYTLTDASVESWHLHWIVRHGFDPIPKMVGRLKTRVRQALAVGRLWTEGYHDGRLFETSAVETRSRYVARHGGCRMTDGVLRQPPAPRGFPRNDL